MKKIKPYTYLFLMIIFGCMIYLYLQRDIKEISITVIGVGERKGKILEIYTAQGSFKVGESEFINLQSYDNRSETGEFYYKARVIVKNGVVRKVVPKEETLELEK